MPCLSLVPRRVILCLILTGLAVSQAAAPAKGEDGKRLSVTGTGTVKVRPDVVEINGIVVGQADLAAEALKKLRDNRRRAAETIAGLKIEGLKFATSGRSMQSPNSAQQMQMIVSGQEGETPLATHVMIYESVTLRLEGIDKLDQEKLSETLVKIIDAGKDAALIIGPSTRNMYMQNAYGYGGGAGSLVTYRISQPEVARQKALELAAKEARTKAVGLAGLLGVKTGGVVSASESYSDMSSNYSTSMYYAQMASVMQGFELDTETPQLNADAGKDHEIPVTAVLQVQYEIVP
jgi:uncharacterized protein YggE